jgi:hypothetical protein
VKLNPHGYQRAVLRRPVKSMKIAPPVRNGISARSKAWTRFSIGGKANRRG